MNMIKNSWILLIGYMITCANGIKAVLNDNTAIVSLLAICCGCIAVTAIVALAIIKTGITKKKTLAYAVLAVLLLVVFSVYATFAYIM